MIGFFDRLSRPLMRALDPEDAHALAIKALRFMPLARPAADPRELACALSGSISPIRSASPPASTRTRRCRTRCCGSASASSRSAPSPRCPQAGNPRPRLFRLESDEGVINRLGFNNEGAAAMLKRLAARADEGGIVGVNIGANRDCADRVGDYVRLIETFAAVAGYFTVNVSSPNTPGLRDLQQAKALDELLARVLDARERVRPRAGPMPVLLKIAPDLTLSDLDDVVGIARKHRVDGMIVGNTTVCAAGRAARARQGQAKRAGCRAGRCSSSRPACWRRPSCAPRARSR